MALISLVFYKRDRLNFLLTGLTALLLFFLATFFPENLTINIWGFTLIFEESLGILGRQITLEYAFLPFIAFIYGMNTLWILSSIIPGVPKTFRSGSLALTALLTAALGVEPFLYAALLIQAAIVLSIPMLSPLNAPTHPGILRYLSLQTLALPFILLAGWLLTGVETLPPDSPLIGQSMLTLGLGFAILLSVFPFHSWLPMVSQTSHATVFSFVVFIMPTTILLFSLNFLEQYTFLRTSTDLYQVLTYMGALMIAAGGLFTAVQSKIKRAFGFSVLTETGFSLLSLGMASEGGLNWMLMLLPSRALSGLLWAHAIALVENNSGTSELSTLKGFAREYPFLSAGLVLGPLSLAGLPLLASFPIKSIILTAAFSISSSLGIWSFVGNLGLFVFTIRLLRALVMPADQLQPEGWSRHEKTYEFLPILLLILVLLALGLFPNTFLGEITLTLDAFAQLQ
jgi:NADH:ubiquinone oxidoreductase subunit 2 (subunit N)